MCLSFVTLKRAPVSFLGMMVRYDKPEPGVTINTGKKKK